MKQAQSGAALAVALVLLTGLSALALAAAVAAITALALAGYQQGAAFALEAAEAGVARALQVATEQPGPATTASMAHSVGGTTEGSFETRTTEVNGIGALLPGFSIGATDQTFQAQHYLIESDGRAARRTRVWIEQGFYVVVPHQ